MRPRNSDTYIEQRFMSFVERCGDCWLWRGPRNHAGYPQFSPHGDQKFYATRWAYERWVSRLDKHERLRSLCGNGDCVAPGHRGTLAPEGRFWQRVDRSDPHACWTFRVAHHKGYGRFTVNGRSTLAHRYSYELLVGPIPDGLTLDHLCRNKSCVNPDHLEPVSLAENVRRMNAGRTTTRPAPASLAGALT